MNWQQFSPAEQVTFTNQANGHCLDADTGGRQRRHHPGRSVPELAGHEPEVMFRSSIIVNAANLQRLTTDPYNTQITWGVRVHLCPCSPSNGNQLWMEVWPQSTRSAVVDQAHCLDADGGTLWQDTTIVRLYPCTGGTNQQWTGW